MFECDEEVVTILVRWYISNWLIQTQLGNPMSKFTVMCSKQEFWARAQRVVTLAVVAVAVDVQC